MEDQKGTPLEIGDWIRYYDNSVSLGTSIGIVLNTQQYDIDRGLIRIQRQGSTYTCFRNHEFIERIPDEEAMLMALEKYAG